MVNQEYEVKFDIDLNDIEDLIKLLCHMYGLPEKKVLPVVYFDNKNRDLLASGNTLRYRERNAKLEYKRIMGFIGPIRHCEELYVAEGYRDTYDLEIDGYEGPWTPVVRSVLTRYSFVDDDIKIELDVLDNFAEIEIETTDMPYVSNFMDIVTAKTGINLKKEHRNKYQKVVHYGVH